MHLIIGLGNPGPEYCLNRHNVGFMILDHIHEFYGYLPPKKSKFGLLTELNLMGGRILTLRPLTFMNKSGVSAADIIQFYKIPLDHVLVIHDDLDLNLGQMRIKCGGGSGGHNGLKSLDATIGADYWRLRFGIGHPGHKDGVVSHVLGNFDKCEQSILPILFNVMCKNLQFFWQKDGHTFKDALSKALSDLPKL